MKNKEPQILSNKIKDLLDQLVEMAQGHPSPIKSSKKKTNRGASGALFLLIDEGFFDTPQDLSSIKGRLQQIGRYYSNPLVAMNLLNLTKRRILNRLKDKKTSNWRYVLRK